jgi:hypothetical protein
MMARAHKVIKPPGNKPKTNSKPLLINSTTRTSLPADTVLAVKGASKYMTLTTRK